MKKILLLTDIYPCKKYSGAILSEQLSQFLIEDNYELYCVCVKNKALTFDLIDDEIKTKVETLFLDKPEEMNKDKSFYEEQIEDLLRKTLNFIKQKEIDTVWCPIQGETILRLLNGVLKNTKNIRIIPQIWDPFSWVLYDLSYPEEEIKELEELFDSTLKESDAILCASDSMSKRYHKKYGKKCRPMYTSFKLEKKEFNNTPKKNEFVITMAGQPYALIGINAMLSALDKMNWKYLGKKIIFRIYGNPAYYPFKDNPRLDFRGYVPQEQLMEEQKKSDLLYCSYFFDDKPIFEDVSQTSYPSKVVSYIPSGVPILIHSKKDTSIYQHMKKYHAGYLLDSLKEEDIIEKIKEIIENQSTKTEKKVIENTYHLYEDTFNREKIKKDFYELLDLPYRKNHKTKIVEINYIDLPGKRFNGYDIMEELNKKNYSVTQLVNLKQSRNKNVIELYNEHERDIANFVTDFEDKYLSIHSCLSTSSPHILQSSAFERSNLVHIHMLHNAKMSLFSLIDICNQKPSIISIHDPWNFTGHCVHYEDCDHYLTGCENCPRLDALFPLKEDNSSELWKIKKYVYDHIDVDYIVGSKYMYDLFKKSPLTKGKRVHLIPLGIDIHYFSKGVTNKEARERYHIPKDHIVIFHRAQKEFKGTNYLEEALKLLDTDKKITILTCSEKNLLDSVKNKYQVIDLGDISSEELKYAYNACDIFLMPSIGESFGLMAVEAMSCGKPVIVFNNTALPSVVFAPKCGIAVENKNSEKLMEAIKWLVEDDKERLKRSKLSLKIVKENYDLKIYNKKMEDLYKEVLKRKHDFSNKEILNKKIEDNQDVRYMKFMLNILSRQIFDRKSSEYKQMEYPKEEIENPKNNKISYHDLSVQLLLNEYNNKLVMVDHNSTPRKENTSILEKIKVYRMFKRFMYLVLYDRASLSFVIKRKYHTLKKIISNK